LDPVAWLNRCCKLTPLFLALLCLAVALDSLGYASSSCSCATLLEASPVLLLLLILLLMRDVRIGLLCSSVT
jgi:hypothetical protein